MFRGSVSVKWRNHSPGCRVSAQAKDIEAVIAPGDYRGLGGEHATEGLPLAGDRGAAFEVIGRRGSRDQGHALGQEAEKSGEPSHGVACSVSGG